MRKTGILFGLFILVASASVAQTSIELIPSVGYSFPSRTDYYDSYGRVDGGLNLGGSIKFNVDRSFGIELLYNHISTQTGLYQYGYGGAKLAGGDLDFDYIMLGAVESFGIHNSIVKPFIGGFLGAAVMTPGYESGYSTDTRFAVGVQLGTNIYIAPEIGIQLKAQMLAPVEETSTDLYFSNYGAGSGFSTYSTIYQFSLHAGLIIGLGHILGEDPYRHYGRPHRRYYRYRYDY